MDQLPLRLLGRVWRKFLNDGIVAIVVVPLWQFYTWWGMFARDGVHFADEVVDLGVAYQRRA